MAVGITHVTQCDACIAYHTSKAKDAGASDEEIAEAVFVAMELLAGSAVRTFCNLGQGHESASAFLILPTAGRRRRRGS